MKYALYLLEAILAVNLLVVVHELGHMLAARLFGVRSLRFSVGLGRRLLGVRFRGTEYCLAPIPMGGYVQLERGHTHGEGSRCMDCVSTWQRVLILFAGPAANLLFVLVLFWTVYSAIGVKDRVPVVADVAPGSPVAEAGLEPGDRFASIGGEAVHTWTQVSLAFENAAEPLDVVVARPRLAPGRPQEKPGAEPQAALEALPLRLPASAIQGMVPSERTVRLRMDPIAAVHQSVSKLWSLSKVLFESVTGLVTARVPPSDLVGPIYLFHISSQAASASQASFLFLLAFISASLFFFNLLPLPVLDGGQIVLACLQGSLKRPLAPRSMKLLTHASLVWLFLLLASATLNDIVRLVGA